MNFPYVFDSFAKAKMTPGFIQGTKMSLPVGFQRKDDRKYEEITIPASNSSITDIPKKLGSNDLKNHLSKHCVRLFFHFSFNL